MTFLPIVARELRVASRRPATYRLRFWLAVVVLIIWFSLLILGRNPVAQRGQMLFMAIGILLLGFCMLAGAFLTADCISEEKRDGTLGLLFLTPLKGYDVVVGKLIATSIHAFYGLLAVLPLLALPLLMGGVTAGEFWRITMVLIATLFFSLSLGLAVSTVTRDTRQAIAASLLAIIVFSGLLPVFWWLQSLLGKGPGWEFLLWPSPAYLYSRAFDVFYQLRTGAVQFWDSLLVVFIIGAGSLVSASLLLPSAWQEKNASGPPNGRLGWLQRLRFGGTYFRLRRRWLLNQNPFHWLSTRDRWPGWFAFLLLASLLLVWAGFLAGCFSNSARTKDTSFGIVMFMGYGIHQVLKCLIAIESTRRLSEDYHSGALELLLVTPISAHSILAGQRRALREIFFRPMVLALLCNAGLFWLIFWANPMKMNDDDLGVFCEMYLGGAVMLLVDFYALTWIGMGMALSTRRHQRAIFATLARVMFLPWLAILFLIFMGMGGRGLNSGDVAALTAFWFLLGIVIDATQAATVRNRLLRDLRPRPLGRNYAASGLLTPWKLRGPREGIMER
jgi:ABC-type transport system involved in cytochrome c biogenesis permease component